MPGVAVIMFVLTMWILLQKGRHQKVNWKMIIAACALLLLATAVRVCNAHFSPVLTFAVALQTSLSSYTQNPHRK